MYISEKKITIDTLNLESFNDFTIIDIETTGFNRITDTIIILGLLIKNNSSLTIKQFISESFSDEKLLLTELLNLDLTNIYTFNGTYFDLPFINKKLELHKLNPLVYKNHIDMFLNIRKFSNYIPVENLKQSSLEYWLGFNRKDTLNSKDIPSIYYNYIKTKQFEDYELVINHNEEDLIGLSNLLNFDVKLNEYLNYDSEELSFKINSIIFNENWITIDGSISDFKYVNISNVWYDEYYHFSIDKYSNKFIFKFQTKTFSIADNQELIATDAHNLNLKNLYFEHALNIPNNIIPLIWNNKYIISNLKLLLYNFIHSLYSNTNLINKI